MVVGELNQRLAPVLVEALDLHLHVVKLAIHRWALVHELRRCVVKRRHLVIALVADLVEAHQLEVHHLLLEIGDPLGEVSTPVIGDDAAVHREEQNFSNVTSRPSTAKSRAIVL